MPFYQISVSGSKTHTVDVIKAPIKEEITEEEEEWSEMEDPNVEALLQYGYALPEVIQALEATLSDLTLAHKMLYSKLTGHTDS